MHTLLAHSLRGIREGRRKQDKQGAYNQPPQYENLSSISYLHNLQIENLLKFISYLIILAPKRKYLISECAPTFSGALAEDVALLVLGPHDGLVRVEHAPLVLVGEPVAALLLNGESIQYYYAQHT